MKIHASTQQFLSWKLKAKTTAQHFLAALTSQTRHNVYRSSLCFNFGSQSSKEVCRGLPIHSDDCERESSPGLVTFSNWRVCGVIAGLFAWLQEAHPLIYRSNAHWPRVGVIYFQIKLLRTNNFTLYTKNQSEHHFVLNTVLMHILVSRLVFK